MSKVINALKYILPILVITGVIIIAVFNITEFIVRTNDSFDYDNKKVLNQINETVNIRYATYKKQYRMAAKFIENDKNIIELFTARDRAD